MIGAFSHRLSRAGFAMSVLGWVALGAADAACAQSPDEAKDEVAVSLCTMIESAADINQLPRAYLTRLIWQESRLSANEVSPAGAQGIAQFMPGTALARGLKNPFDPGQAIPAAASLLADLKTQFGNLGLAAAAYNAGPTAVAGFIRGERGLPNETQNFVLAITGHVVDDWMKSPPPENASNAPNCQQAVASLRSTTLPALLGESLFSPWGVQLSGGFSKAQAVAAFERQRSRYAALIGAAEPFVLARRNLSRGWRTFFAVRLPASSRAEAVALCRKIEAHGGACVPLRT